MINPTLNLQPNSRVPKYIQLANSLLATIRNRKEAGDSPLPSINQLSAICDVSRDTVEKAYRELRKRDLVEAVPGKGYYVKAENATMGKRIFLLFNQLSAHKKIVYENFVETIGDQAVIDFHVYNNDYTIFKRLLEHIDWSLYSHCVIIPHFYRHFHLGCDIINRIPRHKLLILDKRLEGISGEYACVYQDFEQNIYDSMRQAGVLFSKYHTLKLLFPSRTYQPREIIKGFQRFCIEHNYQGKLVAQIEKEPVATGEAYITMMEDDLVTLVKKIKEAGLKVGEEIGILSYNENPLKEVLLDGISVISTVFEELGSVAAQMILENKKEHVENPFRLIVRKSL